MKNKIQILEDVFDTEPEELFEYIKEGTVTLNELKATGRLMRPKLVRIEELIKLWDQEKAADDEFWNDCCVKNTKEGYQIYKRKFSQGVHLKEAEEKINGIDIEREIILQQKINDLSLNTYNYSRLDVAYDDNFTWEEKCMICREIGIQNPEKILKISEDLADVHEIFMKCETLPDIPAKNTDVYFFGIPGSGKSCVVGGVLYQAFRSGVLDPDTHSQLGMAYLESLIKCMDVGLTPKSTPTNSVNYMTFNLRDPDKKIHPISLVEIAGEYFDNLYKGLIGQNTNASYKQANAFLQNNNRKTIFFVIDYAVALTGRSNTEQALKLSIVLEGLKKNGTLSKTDSINVIIAKSDLMNGDVKEEANRFINAHFKAFKEKLESVCQTYGIYKENKYRPRYYTFSLGTFSFKDIFVFNEKDSANIVNVMINSCAKEVKKSWFNI